MPFKETLDIAIISASKDESRIMLAAIVEEIVRKYSDIGDHTVQTAMFEEGKELLTGAEEIAETLVASKRADAYKLEDALRDPDTISEEMEISFRCNDTYCGRVSFHCEDSSYIPEEGYADAALLIIDEEEGPEEISLPKSVPIAVALCTDSDPGSKDALTGLREKAEEGLVDRIMSGEYFCGWYDPYGFTDGERNADGDVQPLGVKEIFWKLIGFAAKKGFTYYMNVAADSLNTISKRRSIFQRHSVRRVLELQSARKDYLNSVTSLYGIEQMIALTENKPLN